MVMLGLLLLAYLLFAPAFGIWGLVVALGERRRVDTLTAELVALRGAPEAPPPAPEARPEPRAEPPRAEPPRAEPPQAEAPGAPAPSAASWRPHRPAPAPAAAEGEDGMAALEASLASRWMVWLGGIALALAGAFLVKYSLDQGWLGPATRVSLGVVLGAALVAGGEWLRRHPPARALAAIEPDYVPPALTAAGVFIAFASIYAGYALYALLAPLAAFALLAAIGLGAMLLAFLHGPLIGLLGLLGGYLTPLLVQTEHPEAWGLFPYLLALTAAAVGTVRLQGWWWLGWAALAGASVWPFLWFGAAWRGADVPAIGLYLLGVAALFLLLRRRGPASAPAAPPRWLAGLAEPDQLAVGAAAAMALVSFALVRMDAYDTVSLIALWLLCALFLAVAWREPALDVLAPLAGLTALAALAAWHLPEILGREPLYTIEGRGFGAAPGPIVPPALVPFALWMAGFGALFGLGGYAALWRAARPALWAGVAAAMPVLLLAVAYWRATGFAVAPLWAVAAVGVGALALAAAAAVEAERGRAGFRAALGAFAAAVVAAASLAATMLLKEAWLTVALALQLPALAWINARLGGERALRAVAAVVAGVVLVRLAFNPMVLDYPLGDVPALNWLLYGYGVPAAAFLAAARAFRRERDDRLVTLLEAGALAFAVLLVSLEIRNLMVGPLAAPTYGLAEQSLQSLAWLAIALALGRAAEGTGRAVALWGSRILAVLAAAQVLLLQALASNPLFTGLPVAGPPVLDTLALAYAAPAGFAAVFARAYRRAGQTQAAAAAGLAAVALVWLYVSLEVRRAFHGPVLAGGGVGEAELYAYSLAWLLYGGALLAAALKTGSAALRYVSLGLFLVVAAKVFLVDMASLTGLARVASFLGLGLALVAIGWVYQRFVFPPSTRAPPDGMTGA